MIEDRLRECLTFDDVLLAPAYSDALPKDVDTKTRLTRSIEKLNVPLPVGGDGLGHGGPRTAITMAREESGIGILHKNLDPEAQALEVQRVKRAESGMVAAPVTARPNQSLREALDIMQHHNISGVPVVEVQTPVEDSHRA